MEAKRTTVWLFDRDFQALDRIRARWGLGSSSDAVRLAIRVLADSEVTLEGPETEGDSRRFTLWFYPEDHEAIEALSRGELTDADVIRAAIRLFAEARLTVAQHNA